MNKNLYITFVFALLSIFQLKAQFANQEGYLSGSVKHVFFDEKEEKQSFSVFNEEGEIVLESKTSNSKEWEHSGTKVSVADISSIKKEGNYRLEIGNIIFPFSIDNSTYNRVGKAILKSFYHARVSEDILEKHAGIYARKAGHPDDKVYIHVSAASEKRPEGSIISSPGGWYDAGDFNKYIVNSSITTYSLLHTLEMFENELASLNINIPESGNGVSDLLDESLVNLEWMRTMQDQADGGVYHKLTSLKFCGMIKPEADQMDRYVVKKSTAASLDFAALFSKASRILKKYDLQFPGYSKTYLEAAKYAYDWAIEHPDITYLNPEGISTGAYDDLDLKDEWLWASMELYLSTGDEKYLNYLQLDDQKYKVPEWRRTNLLAAYSLLFSTNKSVPSDAKNKLKNALMKLADRKVKVFQNSAFKISIKRFPWGSNSEVANDGILLYHAYLLSADEKYLKAADACAGYLLGANPLDLCFVTGFGDRYPMNLHDRRCSSDEIIEPIPGLLAGGPTTAVRADCGEEKYVSDFPALSYVDMECSFSTNEIAINWNSAATALFLGLDAIHKMKDSK